MFEKVGISKGERLQCCMYDFHPYQNGDGTMGFWEGSTCHEPFVTVMSYGTIKDEYTHGEVYSLEAMSMQVTILNNHPAPIKDYRAIVDPLSKMDVSDDDFLNEMDRKDKEVALKKRKAEYAKKDDEKKTTIILASEASEWPTAEQVTQALIMQIPLKDLDNKRKTRVQLVREIKFGLDTIPVIYTPKKKDILCLPEKPEKEVNIIEEVQGELEFIYVEGPRGSVRLSEFTKLTQSGCSSCTGNIHVDDAPHMDWWGNEPICPACVRDWANANDMTKYH